jgi:hypothetical protein
MASKLYDGKVSGRTSASTDGTATGIIATKSIELWDDGILRYSDGNGRARSVQLNGDLMRLFKEMFTGTGQPTARFFGND